MSVSIKDSMRTGATFRTHSLSLVSCVLSHSRALAISCLLRACDLLSTSEPAGPAPYPVSSIFPSESSLCSPHLSRLGWGGVSFPVTTPLASRSSILA